MSEEKKVCKLCSHSHESEENPILRFSGETYEELRCTSYGSFFCHVGCLLEAYTRLLKTRLDKHKSAIDELQSTIDRLQLDLKTRKTANEEVEQIIKEIEEKNNVSLTENIILYRDHKGLFLKVTDYQKGYWAQVPLKPSQILTVLNFFKKAACAEKSEGGG